VKSKREKRKIIRETIQKFERSYKFERILIERVRLYSRGFISTNTVIALGTLVAAVVDSTNLDVFSVDSRSFKSRVVGNSKCSKGDVVKWVKDKFNIKAEEDEADAIAIGYYQFVAADMLKMENN
jgi:Holliday junction resolvasome RuvABC endonuclease subunit